MTDLLEDRPYIPITVRGEAGVEDTEWLLWHPTGQCAVIRFEAVSGALMGITHLGQEAAVLPEWDKNERNLAVTSTVEGFEGITMVDRMLDTVESIDAERRSLLKGMN
jgi:hypothetical protein